MSDTNASLISKSKTINIQISDTKATLISKSKSKTNELQTSEADVIGDILDNCRSWQLKTIFIVYLTKIPTAFFMACIVYTSPIPQRVDVFCKDVSAQTSVNSFAKIMHPPIVSVNDKEFDLSYCDIFADIKEHARMYYGNQTYEMPWISPNISRTGVTGNSNLNIIPCDDFNIKSGKSVTTYDIVCSRGGLVVLTQGMHLVGIFLSGIVARYSMKVSLTKLVCYRLDDQLYFIKKYETNSSKRVHPQIMITFGWNIFSWLDVLTTISPKNVMRIAMILQIICGNYAGLVKSLGVHLIFRALAAIGCAVAFGAGSVIFSDITRGKLKIAALFFFDTFWSIGIILLSFITQYESRWTELYLIISYPTLVIVLLSFWIPDSPRWLLSHGEIEKTLQILVDAARSCHSTADLPLNLAFKLKLQAINLVQEPPPVKWFHLWQESISTTFRLFAVHLAFACFTIMYFGMVLNMPNYGRGNLPKNAKFIATSEIIGCSIGYLFAIKTKRKFQWSGMFNIFGAIIALCMWFWRNREAEFVQEGILLYFCLVLKASVSSSFGILCACSTDLVKKERKSILIFSSILCGRLFLLNAPVVVSLATFYGEYLSLTLFATTGVIGGSAMIFIDLSRKL